MMFYGQPGSTRAALLLEVKDKEGNPKVMIYHLAEPLRIQIDQEFATRNYNIFDGAYIQDIPTKLTVEAYLMGVPREYNRPMPSEKLEPSQLAISSNESEIIVNDEDFESWQE